MWEMLNDKDHPVWFIIGMAIVGMVIVAVLGTLIVMVNLNAGEAARSERNLTIEMAERGYEKVYLLHNGKPTDQWEWRKSPAGK